MSNIRKTCYAKIVLAAVRILSIASLFVSAVIGLTAGTFFPSQYKAYFPHETECLRPLSIAEKREGVLGCEYITPPEIIYEISMRALGKKFKDITDVDILRWKEETGATMLWILDPWKQSPYSKGYNDFWKVRQDEPRDRTASCFAIMDYEFDEDLGTEQEYNEFAERVKKAGVKIMLGVAPNHLAADSPLIYTHPEYLMSVAARRFKGDGAQRTLDAHRGRLELKPENHTIDPLATLFQRPAQNGAQEGPVPGNVFYHGTESSAEMEHPAPWGDTVNVDFTNAGFREWLEQALFKVARLARGGGIRLDMFWLTYRDHIRHQWFNHLSDDEFNAIYPKEQDFWSVVLPKLRAEFPEIVIFPEMYQLYEQGEAAYALGGLYYQEFFRKRLLEGDANALRSLKDYFRWYAIQQRRTHYVKFLEEHESHERSLLAMGRDKFLAASAIMYLTPGQTLVYHEQERGRAAFSPSANTVAGFQEEDDPRIVTFYKDISRVASHEVIRRGSFELADTSNPYVFAFERVYRGKRALCIINFSWDLFRDVEIRIGGRIMKIDLEPWQVAVNAPWWKEDTGTELPFALYSLEGKLVPDRSLQAV